MFTTNTSFDDKLFILKDYKAAYKLLVFIIDSPKVIFAYILSLLLYHIQPNKVIQVRGNNEEEA